MKILIIEDDPIKLLALRSYILECSPNTQIEEKMSYQAGLLAMLKASYDLILLDMQLPNYDIKSGEDGYRLRPMAGRDILREIKRKNINCKVFIVTQYEGFGENGKFATLEEWDKKLRDDFPRIYLLTIRYKPGSNSWKEKLNLYLNKS